MKLYAVRVFVHRWAEAWISYMLEEPASRALVEHQGLANTVMLSESAADTEDATAPPSAARSAPAAPRG